MILIVIIIIVVIIIVVIIIIFIIIMATSLVLFSSSNSGILLKNIEVRGWICFPPVHLSLQLNLHLHLISTQKSFSFQAASGIFHVSHIHSDLSHCHDVLDILLDQARGKTDGLFVFANYIWHWRKL